jgi:hypothetical protein
LVEDVIAIGHLVKQLAETAKLVGNSVTDLAAYVHLGEIIALTDEFLALAADLESVGGRMDGRGSWWRDVAVPTSVEELAAFSLGANGQCWSTFHDAYGLQGLLRRVTGLLRKVTTMISRIGALSGSVAGIQALNGQMSSAGATLQTIAGMMAGVNEARLCEALQTNLERQGMEWVGQEMLKDWGAYTPLN